MKKILYVTTIGLTMDTFLIPHILELRKKGYEVDCACNIKIPLNKKLKENGVQSYHINFSRNPLSSNNLKALKEIRELQEKNKYDVVHVHTPVASFITRYALKNTGIKLVYTCHGFHFYKGAPILNWLLYYPLEKISAKWTDRIITINNEDFERAKTFKLRNNGEVLLMHGVGINPDDYIIENFDRSIYRKQFGVKDDEFMILILAELNKNKNHIQIIKALSLMEDSSNIKVICAGKGPLKEKLESQVKELGLEENIKFIGFRNDVKELLNSCDCVGLFSKREGLGKCLLEGMILNKKIIATKTRGSLTLIKSENENAMLCENVNFVELKEKIQEISEKKIKKYIDIKEYELKEVIQNIEYFNS
ncbi:MAG: glycosyltransferase family 4 protein [Sarcina sp.]